MFKRSLEDMDSLLKKAETKVVNDVLPLDIIKKVLEKFPQYRTIGESTLYNYISSNPRKLMIDMVNEGKGKLSGFCIYPNKEYSVRYENFDFINIKYNKDEKFTVEMLLMMLYMDRYNLINAKYFDEIDDEIKERQKQIKGGGSKLSNFIVDTILPNSDIILVSIEPLILIASNPVEAIKYIFKKANEMFGFIRYYSTFKGYSPTPNYRMAHYSANLGDLTFDVYNNTFFELIPYYEEHNIKLCSRVVQLYFNELYNYLHQIEIPITNKDKIDDYLGVYKDIIVWVKNNFDHRMRRVYRIKK